MLELARELGLALANSAEFITMKRAQANFESNEATSALMQELNEKRDRLIRILAEDSGGTLRRFLTNDIERLEEQLRENPLYAEIAAAQAAFSTVLTAINDEINACIGGETSTGCGGDCGSCGGCKH
jgi:cell fate (sporulation/competence/biofilm development) regulator YlbF (YheA/YmcA/DUF963 family)